MSKLAYKYLLNTYGRQPGYWFAFLAEAVRAFIGRVVTVILLAEIVSAVSVGDFDRAKHNILLWAGLTLGAVTLYSIGELIGHRTENNQHERISVEYYKRLTNKDATFYRDHHTGYLSTMFKQHIDSGLLLVRLVRKEVVAMSITLLFPAVVLLWASWPVGLVAVAVVVTQIAYMLWASAKATKYRLESHEIYREIAGEVADDVTNIIAYKSAGNEAAAQKHIAKLSHKESESFWKRRYLAILLDYPRSVVTMLLVALAFWLALGSENSFGTTIGLLVLTITYMFQIVRNMMDLPELISDHDDLLTKLEPTLEVFEDSYEKINDPLKPKDFRPHDGEIQIRSLTFNYQDDNVSTNVLKDINLTVKSGERLGVVGLSGAGKSTLVNLIMRFDDVQQGEILIDGMNIKDVRQSDLRSHIAYVPQEPLLFHRSIKDNITYHNSNATKQEMVQAAKAAHADEFIKILPKKYDTVVGERGVKLSGGQKQRVVIARAILKRAPIMLFDEATSALDSESEHIIQTALPEIIGSHTAIIIAHRLSTVAKLDRIVVMHEGRIIEDGSHQQLLKKKGRYYSLWKRQTESAV